MCVGRGVECVRMCVCVCVFEYACACAWVCVDRLISDFCIVRAFSFT